MLSACVQMPSLGAIQQVEDKLGLPVTSAAICTTRKMLSALELEPVAPGAGYFLSERNLAEKTLGRSGKAQPGRDSETLHANERLIIIKPGEDTLLDHEIRINPRKAWLIVALLLLQRDQSSSTKLVLGLAAVPIMKELALTPAQYGLVREQFLLAVRSLLASSSDCSSSTG